MATSLIIAPLETLHVKCRSALRLNPRKQLTEEISRLAKLFQLNTGTLTIADGFKFSSLVYILENLKTALSRADLNLPYRFDCEGVREDLQRMFEPYQSPWSPAVRKQFNLDRLKRSRRHITVKQPCWEGEPRPIGYETQELHASNIPSNWWQCAQTFHRAAKKTPVWLRQVRKIFNPEDVEIPPEKIAEIINSEKWRLVMTMMKPSTADENEKPNTVIVRTIRRGKRGDEYLKVADSTDPEFRLAFEKFLTDNKDNATEAEWYVALNLNVESNPIKGWMLYRLELSFDETFPLTGEPIPNREMGALTKLWLQKQFQAEQSAKRKGHDITEAAERVDKAFDRVQAIHYLGWMGPVQVVHRPK